MMTTPSKPSIERTRRRQAVEVRTDAYWRSHGRGPRGRGGWLFQMEDADGRQIDAQHPIWDELFAAKGTYGEALKAAKAEARRLGARSIIVCP
jgi:hypothetical protein